MYFSKNWTSYIIKNTVESQKYADLRLSIVTSMRKGLLFDCEKLSYITKVPELLQLEIRSTFSSNYAPSDIKPPQLAPILSNSWKNAPEPIVFDRSSWISPFSSSTSTKLGRSYCAVDLLLLLELIIKWKQTRALITFFAFFTEKHKCLFNKCQRDTSIPNIKVFSMQRGALLRR